MAVLVFLLVVVAVLAMFLLLRYHWTRRRMYLLASQLDGPTAWPVVGNGHSFMCDADDRLDSIRKLIEPYQSPVRVWLGPELFLFIKHPDQVQAILSSTKLTVKADLYRFLQPFLGQGLFTASGAYHKSQRKVMQPLFNPKVLEVYSHLFYKHALSLVESLKKHVDGPAFDFLLPLHDSAFAATMDILMEDTNEHSVDYKDAPGYIRRVYALFISRVTTFWKHPDFIYKFTKDYEEIKAMKEMVTTMTQEIANSKVNTIIERLNKRNEAAEDDVQPTSMLELMIDMVRKNPNCLTETELVDHLVTFVGTAQDTQSSTIAFTLLLLGMHPNIQEKVIEEIKTVVGDTPRKIEYSDLGRLKYMEMCIKEAMRLYAVAPFIFRKTTEDFQFGKWIIPPGCSLAICIFNLHRDPNHWERPEEFYPEHFSSEAVLNRHPYAYVPFSAGPRRCIAQQYSYTNMKIIIGTVLQHFVVESDETVKTLRITTDISVRPVKGHMIRLKERRSL